MEPVITLEGVRPLIPAVDAAAWHQTPAALALIFAIVDLHAVAGRLETLRNDDPSQHEAREAASMIGRISNKPVMRQFSRGCDMIAAPSNGACAVSVLWEALAAGREVAIDQQMKAEGLPLPHAAGLTQEQADAAFDRREELDRDALTVAQAVCLALTAGRA